MVYINYGVNSKLKHNIKQNYDPKLHEPNYEKIINLVANAVPLMSGFCFMIISDSAILKSDKQLALNLILKSCSFMEWLHDSACSLILEKPDLVIGVSVLYEIPLCSTILILRFQSMYLDVQSEHLKQ